MLLSLIPPQIKLGLAVAAVVLIGFLGWRLHAAVEKNGTLEAKLEASQAQVRAMAAQMHQYRIEAEQDIAARDAATAEARKQAEANARKATQLAQQLHEARSDAQLSHCLDMRLPDAISLPE